MTGGRETPANTDLRMGQVCVVIIAASTVVAYLHWTQGMTLDEAMDFVMQRRFCDPYMDAIRQATANWAAEGGCGG